MLFVKGYLMETGGCQVDVCTNIHLARLPINKGLSANEVDVVDVFRENNKIGTESRE